MLFPYRIETLFLHYPRANWVLIAAMVIFHFTPGDWYSYEFLESMVLSDWSASGFLGHMWLHDGLDHLVGNMIMLWIFGNAVCGNIGNRLYLPLFFALGVAAGAVHLIGDGRPVVGASGAVYGILGVALAMYPFNRVTVAWWAVLRFGSFQVPLWGLAAVWAIGDALGMLSDDYVAHLAHLGGLFAGVLAGWWGLRRGWLQLTEFDQSSLEEFLARKPSEERRARLRAEREAERLGSGPAGVVAGPGAAREEGGPWAQQAAAAGDPVVMPATAAFVQGWHRRASEMPVSGEDAARIQAGGPAAERRRFELLYGASFGAMGYSFHRSLADYYRRVAEQRIWPHEGPALASFLRLIEDELPAMRACGFVEEGLVALRDEGRVREFLGADQVPQKVR